MKIITLYRLAAAIAIFLGLAIANENGYFYSLDQKLAEQRMQLSTHPASGKIALLEIDTKSLNAIGLWPWKRSIYGEIIEKSFAAGAEEFAFDIDFSASSSPEEDAAFEAALADAAGPVTLAIFQQRTDSSANARVQTNRPIEQLEMNAWMATVNVLADPDGMIRHFPYAQIVGDEAISSLAGVLGGAQDIIPGTFMVDYGLEAETIPVFSVIDLLEGRLPVDALKGRKVLLGAGAAELRDTMAVPNYGMLTGPKLQILAAENILQGRDLAYAPRSWIYGFAAAIFLPILVFSVSRRFNTHAKLAIFALLAVCVEVVGFAIYTSSPVILQTGMTIGLIISSGIALIFFEIRFKDIMLTLSKRRSENITALLETIVEDSFSGILITTEKGEILEISQQAKDILQSLGYRAEKGLMLDGNMPQELIAVLEHSLQDPQSFIGDRQLRSVHIEHEGESRYFEYSITPSQISSGRAEDQKDRWVATILFHDVTKATLEKIKLEYLADHDQLTNLLNQKGFCNEVDEKMIASLEENALVFTCHPRRLDKISQSLGNEYADLLLKQIAERLTELDEFELVGCNGQKEFLLCKLGAPIEECAKLAQIIEECLDAPFSVRGHNVIAGSNIGIADFKEGGLLADEVVTAAIVALHRAKENDEEFVTYTSDLAADVVHRRVLEREIVDALARDEFEMVYQPQASLKDHSIIGCEALIRWQHRDLGLIRPDLFIPIMEETGRIVELGRWIIEQSCRDAMTWKKPITVAVNVSAVQFARSDVLADIKHALEVSGLPKERLQVEITESLFIADPDAIIQTLNAIRDEGIKIALDDFGTGYSSLSYIHQFPLDKIKIDRAFVKDLPHSMDSLAVINAVTALAKGFDMDIVAEGMETKEQASILHLAGCHIGQGWYFGKPMSSNKLNDLCSEGQPDRERLVG